MKRASPMPTGAMKVAVDGVSISDTEGIKDDENRAVDYVPLCFSFANMKIVNTNSAVNTASMNTPLANDVSADNVVRTFSGVGNMTETKKLEKIPPASWAISSRKNRTGDRVFVSIIAKVTAGLNSPPDMRKKIQTLTMSEKAKTRAMYCKTAGEKPVAAPVVVLESLPLEPMLATWVPAKAKKRNMVVPTNSPMKATKSKGGLV
jgi:hypothetical protein